MSLLGCGEGWVCMGWWMRGMVDGVLYGRVGGVWYRLVGCRGVCAEGLMGLIGVRL
jgi:hypothetical protein